MHRWQQQTLRRFILLSYRPLRKGLVNVLCSLYGAICHGLLGELMLNTMRLVEPRAKLNIEAIQKSRSCMEPCTNFGAKEAEHG